MSDLIALTPENYYSQEANMQYVSVSQYKDFNGTTGKLGCEAYAMAKLRGEVEEVSTTPLLVGSYVDAYFEGTLPTFSAQHPEIFSSRGKTAGELKAEYKQASAMIDRAEKDKVFMQYMAGDKQVIMTGERVLSLQNSEKRYLSLSICVTAVFSEPERAMMIGTVLRRMELAGLCPGAKQRKLSL